MFKSKTSMKVISLIAALALWIYVMGEVDPEVRAKIGPVPISFENTEVLSGYGLAVACDEQPAVNVTVSGKRSDVNEVKKNGLTADADVANCELGENTVKITVNLPDGISLENMTASSMTVEVEEMAYEYKPVVIEFPETAASNESVAETVPWIMDHYPSKIMVMGAKSSVDKIDRLLGVVDPEEAVLDREKEVGVKLVPVNKKGKEIFNVDLYQEEASVTVRELAVSVVDASFVAEDATIDLDKYDLPERVRIAGVQETIDDIDIITGSVSVNGGHIYIDTDLPEDIVIMLGEDDGKIIWN